MYLPLYLDIFRYLIQQLLRLSELRKAGQMCICKQKPKGRSQLVTCGNIHGRQEGKDKPST